MSAILQKLFVGDMTDDKQAKAVEYFGMMTAALKRNLHIPFDVEKG